MNVRDMINELVIEYQDSLIGIIDGKATVDQQKETIDILNALNLYTNRLMLFDNDEIEGT